MERGRIIVHTEGCEAALRSRKHNGIRQSGYGRWGKPAMHSSEIQVWHLFAALLHISTHHRALAFASAVSQSEESSCDTHTPRGIAAVKRLSAHPNREKRER